MISTPASGIRLAASASTRSGGMFTAPGRCAPAYASGGSASTRTSSSPRSIFAQSESRSISTSAVAIANSLPIGEPRPSAGCNALVRVAIVLALALLVVVPTASAKFDLSLRLSDDVPRAREPVQVALTADPHVGPCRMKLVAVAPRVDRDRALEALVNGSATVYGPGGGVRQIEASPRLGLLVHLTRADAGTWRGELRFPRAGAWHLVVPNWCAPGIASPRPLDRRVTVRRAAG